jgi:cysteine-rich repeat protein
MPDLQNQSNNNSTAPVADAANGVASTTNSLEAELTNAVHELQEHPLNFPSPPVVQPAGNDFAGLQSLPPVSGVGDISTNAVDLSQTQIGSDPFASSVTPEVIKDIEEDPTIQSDATKKSGSDSKKIILAVIAVIIMGGIAFMTVSIISNRGTNSIAPNAPESMPQAAEVTPQPKIKAPVCGNGQVEGKEVCDDGNIANGDGCSSGCKSETTSN